jgi:hypothetical protein
MRQMSGTLGMRQMSETLVVSETLGIRQLSEMHVIEPA